MRIKSIEIEKWRHFENVSLTLPDGAPIICLVGGNGTGKSQILELIAACAQRIGLAAGTESSRGNPFSEAASFRVTFVITEGAVLAIDNADGPLQEYGFIGPLQPGKGRILRWDRTITLGYDARNLRVWANGVEPGREVHFAEAVIEQLRGSRAIHYLSLDADRAYPKIQIQSHELSQAFDRDWDTTLKESSYRITRTLYEEWFRFLIGKENQENNHYIQEIRLARSTGAPQPEFFDRFDSYKEAVQRVLPHLLFVGIDPQKREIRFDSTGTPLSFDQLSGGEREIAFLIGQIERFALRKGLLLVDEPELHLNYDLLRSWIGFLKASVENGQIWLATHSLEVVEVTGQDATFLLERDPISRRVTRASPLNTQPVVTALSRAMGSPAFSITGLSFVLVEGEEEIGERERFRLLADVKPHVRFMEAGSCNDVVRRMETLKMLAAESGQGLRIGGVVDGDWRSPSERAALAAKGLFVLPTHEVENFFLHPATLHALVQNMGGDPNLLEPTVLAAADRRAGSWIFNAARTDKAFVDFEPPAKATRELIHSLDWTCFADPEARCQSIAASDPSLNPDQIALLARHMVTRVKIYQKRRENDIWRTCEGKEVFRTIVPVLGFADEDAAERAIAALWSRQPNLLPAEVQELRAYIDQL